MGPKHTRDDILRGALEFVRENGIGELTFGRLAKHLGTSDRVIVYYFPNKEILVGDVLGAVGLELQATLAGAFSAAATDHLELLRTAWPLLATDEADKVFSLFFEAAGMAAAGREPYEAILPTMVEMWIDWTASFIDGPEPRARSEAEAAVALIDGLLLLRQVGGPDPAARAAETIGII
ncbi:MAG: TetR/AcrR family transcriptional regulator [Microthrixaceae bacterium]